jgi:uncharacterized membrane protein
MLSYHWTKFFHLIGLGLFLTTIFAGWILNSQYRKSGDWKTKALLLKALRPIGLLSPLAGAVMILSGIGNLFAYSYWGHLPPWMHAKLTFVALLIVTGIFSGVRSKKRSMLIQKFVDGTAPAHAEATVAAMDTQATVLLVVQACMLLAIAGLSIVKP